MPIRSMKEKYNELVGILLLKEPIANARSPALELLERLQHIASEFIDLCRESSGEDFGEFQEEASFSFDFVVRQTSERLIENERIDEACSLVEKAALMLFDKNRLPTAWFLLTGLGESLFEKMKFDRAKGIFEELYTQADALAVNAAQVLSSEGAIADPFLHAETHGASAAESLREQVFIFWFNAKENCLRSWHACELCINSNLATRGIRPLVEMLKGGELAFRVSSAKALGLLRRDDAIEPLAQALTDRETPVRKEAILALEKIGNRRASPLLVKALEDPIGVIRYHAVVALAGLGDETAIEALSKMNNDPDEPVRIAAKETIEMIKTRLAISR